MQLARVVGTVVATRKEESLQGLKLLLVRPLDDEGRESGNAIVSADAVGAGPDEIVLIAAGSSARQTAFHRQASRRLRDHGHRRQLVRRRRHEVQEVSSVQ